jgi:hypothetical protein
VQRLIRSRREGGAGHTSQRRNYAQPARGRGQLQMCRGLGHAWAGEAACLLGRRRDFEAENKEEMGCRIGFLILIQQIWIQIKEF